MPHKSTPPGGNRAAAGGPEMYGASADTVAHPTPNMVSALLQAAYRYVWQGWPVIPARRNKPIVQWTPFKTRLPTDAEIAAWPWNRADGLALVMSDALYETFPNLWLLDIERPHRDEAERWLDAHVRGWRDGLVGESGSGGLHVYCQASQRVATVPGIPWGDITGHNALGYLPPTRSAKTGRHYHWISEGAPLRLEPNRIPGMKKQRPPVREIIAAGPITEKNPGRNQTLFRLGCLLRANGFDPATIEVVLHAVNTERCEPALTENEVTKIAQSVGQRYAPTPRLPRLVIDVTGQAARRAR